MHTHFSNGITMEALYLQAYTCFLQSESTDCKGVIAYGLNAIMLAIRAGTLRSFLAAFPEADLDACCKQWTPLVLAVLHEDVEAVCLLVEAGADATLPPAASGHELRNWHVRGVGKLCFDGLHPRECAAQLLTAFRKRSAGFGADTVSAERIDAMTRVCAVLGCAEEMTEYDTAQPFCGVCLADDPLAREGARMRSIGDCGHEFCSLCLRQLQKFGTTTCPICRAPVAMSNDDNVVIGVCVRAIWQTVTPKSFVLQSVSLRSTVLQLFVVNKPKWCRIDAPKVLCTRWTDQHGVQRRTYDHGQTLISLGLLGGEQIEMLVSP